MYINPKSGVLSGLMVGNTSLYIRMKVFYTDIAGTEFHSFVCLGQPTHNHDLRKVLQRMGTPDCHDEIK